LHNPSAFLSLFRRVRHLAKITYPIGGLGEMV
jgi:hypothetical protein